MKEAHFMIGTAIVGAVFLDIKGYPFGPYSPTGTNIGTVEFADGGVARNVAENFGALGMPCNFVSSVDYSSHAQSLRNRLRQTGVNTDYLISAENAMGKWLAVFDDHGDLAGSVSHQPDFSALEQLIAQRGAEIIRDCDSLILEIDMNERLADALLRLAERYNKKVYVIVGNMGVILRRTDFLRRVDCFICNEIEAGRLFGRDLTVLKPDELLTLLPGEMEKAGLVSMIVTMGPQGAVYFDARTGESGHCPARPCRLVDSTGAGDAFLSGAVMGLTRGLPLKTAVRAGSKLAAMVIQRKENAAPPTEGFFSEFETSAF